MIDRISNLFLIPVLLFVIECCLYCKKPEDRNCFKASGKIESLNIDLIDRHTVTISDNLSLHLINDSLNYIELVGPKNLLKKVEFEVVGDTILLSNRNRCKVLRNENDITVNYHYSSLERVNLKGYGKLTNKDTVKHNLFVIGDNSFSTVNLTLDNQFTHISLTQGSIPVFISGKTDAIYLYGSGHAPIDAKDLYAKKVHVHNAGLPDFSVYASEEILVELRDKGNIHVFGSPVIKSYLLEGSGQIYEY